SESTAETQPKLQPRFLRLSAIISQYRSHDAVIRVYDAAFNVIGTHEHKGEFKEWVSLPSLPLRLQICLRSRCLRGRSKPQRTIRSCASRTTERGHVFIAGRTTTPASC